MKKLFSKITLIRTALIVAATAAILLLVPRADHQSYTYELNQPWKYPLLTADFDTPILRDSASVRQMRDSIEDNFMPFALRNDNISAEYVGRFSKYIANHASQAEARLLRGLLADVYSRGIASNELYTFIHKGNNTRYRLLRNDAGNRGEGLVTTADGADLMSQKMAFDYIDSLYAIGTSSQKNQMSAELARALSAVIVPNVMVDSVNDSKYRNQEYLNVNAALGVIKKGQRIVDRGEIVNSQIFTNLNTYQEMMLSKQDADSSHSYFYVGQGLYILCVWLMLYAFLAIYRPAFWGDIRKMTFIVTFITLMVVISTLVFEYSTQMLYLMPFAAVPVIVMVFFDSRTAIFSLLTAVFLTALIATFQFQFIVLELAAGLCATFTINHLSKRSQLLRTAAITLVVYCVTYLVLSLISDGNFSGVSPRTLLLFVFNALILSFAYVLILIIEKGFGFTSMVTLVELSDINNPLLRRLAEVAPGTFQHSIQVSTLAAEAARAVGANVQLVRTGALYHDIGKMESPVFFTENQHGINPHAGLDPEVSAHKIISHVADGLAMASKAKLPAVIKDFISQHHGKGITKFFYNTAVNESNGTPVDRSRFQYPGPNPQSKETAIMMMADSIEAASRSLQNYSKQNIDDLVDKIIDSQIADGLFKDSPISFKDIETVKDTFKKRLATIYHTRVAYPEINKPQDTPAN